MKDENVGEYKGITYVAQDADKSLSCKGCAAVDAATGDPDLEFCNAMPDCMGCDRRDRRDVVFVQSLTPSAATQQAAAHHKQELALDQAVRRSW